MPGTVDLFVLTLGADQVYDVMKDLVDHGKARSVILIAGGMGEKEGGASIEDRIRDLLSEGRRSGKTTPVVNGGNCLGVVSKPGLYDTLFIPDYKLPRPKERRLGDGDDQPERGLHDLPHEQAAVDRARLFRLAGQPDRPHGLRLPELS